MANELLTLNYFIMKVYKINTIFESILFSLLAISCSKAQPGTAILTPVKNIQLHKQEVGVQKKWILSGNHSVNIPEGYKATVFYTGKLSKPRFMTWGPDSVIYVANMNSGEVIALPDKDHDLMADTVIVAAKDAYGHDLEFFKGDLYVAEEKKVLKFSDTDKDGIFETRTVFIDNILPGKMRPPGGHTTRTIVFDEAGKKIYLSVGSLCNVCRETERAVIYAFDLDGKNQRIYASGARNCVGMTMRPSTGELWATNNGSDNLGNDIPPEWIDRITKGGFYGYPFAYGNGVYYDFTADSDYKKIPPITKEDSANVKRMKAPAALVQAHSAPMAIEFSNKSFKNYSDGAFVAYRGSWNRTPPTGYKIVYLHFKNDKITQVSDFVTGFLPPAEKPWARPVGLLTDARGNLYMSSDDINEFILVISPKARE
jgi:glucose/arabinose dehydrogenase